MLTSNYSQGYKNIKWTVLLLFIWILGACTPEPKEEQDMSYLGYPQTSILQARLIPSKWAYLASQLGDHPKTQQGTPSASPPPASPLVWLENVAQEYPTLTQLLENYTALKPDLSTNWVASLHDTNGQQSASVYLSFDGQQFFTEWAKSEPITTHQIGSKTYLTLDPEAPGQLAILTQEQHMLLIFTTSEEPSDLQNIIRSSFYPNKATFLEHFKNQFNQTNQLVNINLNLPKNTASYIQNPSLQELLNGQKIKLGLDLNPSDLQLNIKLEGTNLVSKLFKPIASQDEQKTGLAMHLDLELFLKHLDELDLRDELDYELKKIKLTTQELAAQFTGQINVSYLGKTKKREKSISYEFDENFNEIEKISYNTLESHDFGGEIGIKSMDKTGQWLNSLGLFSKTAPKKYSPIGFSSSPLEIQPDRIKIGTKEPKYSKKTKLLIQSQNLQAISGKGVLSELNSFKTVYLELDTQNQLTLKLGGQTNEYEYLKTLKNIIAPSL